MKKDKKVCRSRFGIANRFQRKILNLVFFSTVIPMVICVICLYYLIFNTLANELGIPEAIGYLLVPAAQKTAGIAVIGFLVSVCLVWIWAFKVSHKLAGPLERLGRELDERAHQKKRGHIYFRKGDYLAVMAGKINLLLDRLNQEK